MTLTELESLLEQFKKLPAPVQREANLFSVGARGHYENPVSDVLAFYLDADNEHGLDTLVLEALIACLPKPEAYTAALVAPPEREAVTEEGSRIDILLEGDAWVMAIENKVWHLQNNPFDDYAAHLDHEDYAGKTPACVVLSPKGGAPKGWISVSYRQLTQALLPRLGDAFVAAPLNKWLVFLREYVLHLESLMSYQPLPSENEKFVLSNMHHITELEALKKSVAKSLLEEGQRYLAAHFSAQEYEISARQHTYKGIPMLRYTASHWVSKSDVVLYLDSSPDTWFWVFNCTFALTDDALRDRAITMLDVEGCDGEYQAEKRNTCFCFYTYYDPETTDKATLWKAIARRMELQDRFELEGRTA